MNNTDTIIQKVRISDINARVVMQYGSNFENLNVSTLTKGIYVLTIEGQNAIINKKMVINN